MTLPLPNPVVDPNLFATASSLAGLRREVAAHNPKALRAAAQQFESLFINMVLKSMQDANFKDPLFGSSQSRMYQDMYDEQLSIQLSKEHSFGLAEMLVQQLRTQWASEGSATRASPAPAVGGPVSAAARAAAPPESGGAIAGTPSATAQQQGAFARSIWPDAQRAAHQLGVTPVALVAQAALETNWGRDIPQSARGQSSNNLFGIKAGAGWSGASVGSPTREYVDGTPTATEAQFRAYGSCGQCFHDYAALLARNPRYSAALGTGNDVGAFAAALQRGGYATDPNYARKLTAVADTVSRVLGTEPLKLAAATPIATGSSTL